MNDTNDLSPTDLAFLEAHKADKPMEIPDTPEKVVAETEKNREETKAVEEPKVEPKDVAKDAAKEEGEGDGRHGSDFKKVPLGVLRAEREARKEALARVRELEARLAQAAQPPKQERQLTAEEVPQVALAEVRQIKEAIAESQAKQQFIQRYSEAASKFERGDGETPGVEDFKAAYQHALGARRQIYEIAGYPPQQVEALLESEEAAIVERAFLNGENPAAKIYEIAKLYGYQAKAKEQPKDETAEKLAETQQKTAEATVEAAKKLQQIQKGMEKNKNLSGGSAANDEPGLEELAMMDEDEFAKATSGKKFRSLMGG